MDRGIVYRKEKEQYRMNIQKTVKEVIKKLKALADPERLAFAKKSYPTAMTVIGVTVPEQRRVEKELKKTLRNVSKEEVLDVVSALVDTGIFECQHVAYKVLSENKNALSSLDQTDLKRIGKNLDNWVSVDNYAGLLVGPAWRDGRISDKTIHGWARSHDFWKRRAAVVCTVALNQKARGGEGDPKRTLEVCRRVVRDKEEMVAKALSWALRELAKRDIPPVKAFLSEHEGELPARVLREVKKKIETGKKGG
jgi:3-methyladenine DNA glycosylase AlkD